MYTGVCHHAAITTLVALCLFFSTLLACHIRVGVHEYGDGEPPVTPSTQSDVCAADVLRDHLNPNRPMEAWHASGVLTSTAQARRKQ